MSAQDAVFPMSPAEILRWWLQQNLSPSIVSPDNVVVGPLSHTEQQEGAVSLMTAGAWEAQTWYLAYPRIQIRCLGRTGSDAEVVARHVSDVCNLRSRLPMFQPSTDTWWLVHWVRVTGGPSDHFDSPEAWEGLLFADMTIGLDSIPATQAP